MLTFFQNVLNNFKIMFYLWFELRWFHWTSHHQIHLCQWLGIRTWYVESNCEFGFFEHREDWLEAQSNWETWNPFPDTCCKKKYRKNTFSYANLNLHFELNKFLVMHARVYFEIICVHYMNSVSIQVQVKKGRERRRKTFLHWSFLGPTWPDSKWSIFPLSYWPPKIWSSTMLEPKEVYLIL